MAETEVGVTIRRPVVEVFEFACDPSTHVQWQKDLDSDELLDGTGDVGTRRVEVRRLMGRTVTTKYEITECDPPRRWAMRAMGGPVRAEGAMHFESVDEGSTRVTATLKFSGPLGGPLARLGHRQFAGHLENLKELLESQR